MVYFCHVPVFNTRTENEERGWFLSPYLCSLLLDILPWSLLLSALLAHLPKSLPRVSIPSHQHGSYSLSGLFRMLLVLLLFSPMLMQRKPFIPDPPMPTHCTQDLTPALNLTGDIAKRLPTGWGPPGLSFLRGGAVFPSSLCHQGPGGVLCLAHQEVFCEGSPYSVWKGWQRMVSIAQNQGRKKCWLVHMFYLACMLFKKFLNRHIRER